jgi:enamine deaminase RidA (YjgF/YER057c/UK114 family)
MKTRSLMKTRFAPLAAIAAIAAATLMAGGADAQVRRTPIPNSNFPISVAVTVPAGAETVYFSGVLPDVADATAPKGTPAAYGNTQAQTHSVLRKLQAALAAEGLAFGDVAQLRVFLVGDPLLDNKLDFNGLNAAFGQYFGTAAQPGKPARTAVQVAALPAPGALVEIDLVAVRVKPQQ